MAKVPEPDGPGIISGRNYIGFHDPVDDGLELRATGSSDMSEHKPGWNLIVGLGRPKFLNTIKHAVGQLVEHAGENVSNVSVSENRDEKRLRVTIEFDDVDLDAYHIGDLRQK